MCASPRTGPTVRESEYGGRADCGRGFVVALNTRRGGLLHMGAPYRRLNASAEHSGTAAQKAA